MRGDERTVQRKRQHRHDLHDLPTCVAACWIGGGSMNNLDLDAIKEDLQWYSPLVKKLIAELERLRQELATAKKIGAAEELERKIAQIRADLNDMNPDAYKRRGKVEPGYCEALDDIAQGLECRAAELRAEVAE